MGNYYDESTICAQASGSGAGAVTVLRLSGPRSIEILDQVFTPAGKKPLRESENYKMRFGMIRRGEELISPRGNTDIRIGDGLLIMAKHKTLQQLAKDFFPGNDYE
jgi:Trk K+ transport system NAD-binding subunit